MLQSLCFSPTFVKCVKDCIERDGWIPRLSVKTMFSLVMKKWHLFTVTWDGIVEKCQKQNSQSQTLEWWDCSAPPSSRTLWTRDSSVSWVLPLQVPPPRSCKTRSIQYTAQVICYIKKFVTISRPVPFCSRSTINIYLYTLLYLVCVFCSKENITEWLHQMFLFIENSVVIALMIFIQIPTLKCPRCPTPYKTNAPWEFSSSPHFLTTPSWYVSLTTFPCRFANSFRD